MASTFRLEIVTPDRALLTATDAVSVIVPGAEGYFGILAGHAPLAALMVPGEITLKRAGGVEEYYATSGGFVEVLPEGVTILADTAETPDEIDVERAKAAYRRATDRLQHLASDVDVERARAALQRAAARLTVAGEPLAK